MHCDDVNYCDVRRKSFKHRTITNSRICDYYEPREGDAIGWNSGYKPRKHKEEVVKNKRIKVIIKEPGEKPKIDVIDNTLDALQKIVDGNIEVVTVGEYLAIVNEDAIFSDKKFNLTWAGHQLFGTAIFCGADGEEFADYPGLNRRR